jgi:hypothetical protein
VHLLAFVLAGRELPQRGDARPGDSAGARGCETPIHASSVLGCARVAPSAKRLTTDLQEATWQKWCISRSRSTTNLAR